MPVWRTKIVRRPDRSELFHQQRLVAIGLIADVFLLRYRNAPEYLILDH